MKQLFIFSLCSVAIVLIGCTHTVVGGSHLSPDKRYRLGIKVHGASAKAYTAQSNKRIYLWIKPNIPTYPAPPFEISHADPFDKKFIFHAADLTWNVTWLGSDEVSIEFFDYGDGVSSLDRRGMSSNHIASLSFYRDAKIDKFVEKK